jgi:hypothetical protein
VAFYGATGPLVPSAEARLTYSGPDRYGHPFAASAPSWAAGGGGILYSYSPRQYQVGESLALECGAVFCGLASRDQSDTCLALLPPTGGSASWEMCETRPFHTDSTDLFLNATVNAAGQVLYTEMTGQPTLPFSPPPFPLGMHAELWLGSAGNLAPRQMLLTLYHDHLGIDQSSPGSVNWLSETTWSGNNVFLAIGGHLFPADSLRPRGLVVGTITASGATISVVPGTASDSMSHFGLVSGGAAVIFIDGTAVIRRVDVASGVTTVVATLALSAAGRSLDVGCRPDACIVLTRDGAPAHWDLWKLDVASGALTLARTFTHELTAAKLSPASGDVVALEGPNLYFLAGVLP